MPLKREPDMDIINSAKKKYNVIYFYLFHRAYFCISINRVIKFRLLYDLKAGVEGQPLGQLHQTQELPGTQFDG